MAYKFTTHPVGDYKMVHFRGKTNHEILVGFTTSPKKILRYFEELKKNGYIPDHSKELEFIHNIYETALLSNLMDSSTPRYTDTIMRLKINESCLANDGPSWSHNRRSSPRRSCAA